MIDNHQCEYKQPTKNWKEGYVYILDYGDGKVFKIGHTTTSPEKRLKQICNGNVLMPMQLVISAEIYTNCKMVEELLHMRLESEHIRGEWFRLRFSDFISIYQILYAFTHTEINLHERWFELVPEDWRGWVDADWPLLQLPFFTREDKEEFDNFDFSKITPENYPSMFLKELEDE